VPGNGEAYSVVHFKAVAAVEGFFGQKQLYVLLKLVPEMSG
jgi:hypothetical protein